MFKNDMHILKLVLFWEFTFDGSMTSPLILSLSRWSWLYQLWPKLPNALPYYFD